MFNWFDSRYPSHVRNEVNDAYRESLVAMPPLAMPDNAECIVELGEAGAGAAVTARAVAFPDQVFGVIADAAGRAWLELPHPGEYDFKVGDRTLRVKLPGREEYFREPGFDRIMRIDFGEETSR